MFDQGESETPTLARVIFDAIDNRLANLHVSMPARVVSYDPATQKAVVQPELNRLYRDGTNKEWPTILDVPVVWPRAGGAILHFPLEEGDQVTLLVCERSIDDWKEAGGSVSPSSGRRFDVSDCFALPGGYPFSRAFSPSPNGKDVQLLFGNAKMKITKGGKFEFRGVQSELLDLLFQAIQAIATSTCPPAAPLTGAPQLAIIAAKLAAMKA